MIHLEGVNDPMIANNVQPFFATHPGEVLKDEVKYRHISQRQLAADMGMSYKMLNDILNERKCVSTETALLFEAALGIPAETLLQLQMKYNIAEVKKNQPFISRLSDIRKIVASITL